MVGMRINIRVDADCYARFSVFCPGQLIDDEQFLYRFDVETKNIFVKRLVYFLIRFTYPCKNNPFPAEAGVNGCFNLVAAHAVGPKAARLNSVDHLLIKISLHGVMHMKAVTAGCVFTGLQRLAQHVKVVIIKRGLQSPEPAYRCFAKHIFNELLNGIISCLHGKYSN